MAHSVRAHLAAGVAVVVTSAVVVAPSLAPPPAPRPATSHAVELSAVVRQLPSIAVPYILPTLSDEVKRGPIPSLGAPLPTLNLPAPAPTATNVNQAIKNVYNAAEPWVRYGFEVATYAVGWIPYVGWLSPQIMIFYNFGERIVRSITFNLDDWVFGPLPFGEGLANVARDSWNATVQLGRDQVNFWLPPLPPLPPLPSTAQAPTAPTVDGLRTVQQPDQASAELPKLRDELQPRDLPTRTQAGARKDMPSDPVTAVERTLHEVATKVSSLLAPVREAAPDRARLTLTRPSIGTSKTPTTDTALVRNSPIATPRGAAAGPGTAATAPRTATTAKDLRNRLADQVSRLVGSDAPNRSRAPEPRPTKAEDRTNPDETGSQQ